MSDIQASPALAPRKIPAPSQNLESRPFWEAGREGRFVIKRCKACGQAHWYPRNMCPFCHSLDTVFEESKGEGVIYTFSIMRVHTPSPFAIAYVTLDEGVSVLTNIVDTDLEALKIGRRVKLKWTPTEDGLPVFAFTPI